MKLIFENLSIRATIEDIAKTLDIPERNVRDYHFEWLFLEKFKTYEDILEFVNEFEPKCPKSWRFKGFMDYYENSDSLKSSTTCKRKWACGALAYIRRVCGGNYHLGSYKIRED